ncbi:MAG: hypothetical protein ABSA85_02765 [Terracidiphilus sp.]|jgi:hypothetical protein
MINVNMEFDNQADLTNKGTVSIDCKATGTKPNVQISFTVTPHSASGQPIAPIAFTLTWSDTDQLVSIVDDILNANPNS